MKLNKKSSRTLIIGGHGLVGECLIQFLERSKYRCYKTTFGRKFKDSISCDITNPKDVQRVFKLVKPTHVFHCANLNGGAAYCQTHPNEAKKFHFEATKYLVKECQKYGAKFIYISTECVFDGTKKKYRETDSVSPVNVYGQYKVKSEDWIKNNLSDYLIVRTMSVFGWQPDTKSPNAVMSLYFNLRNQQEVFAPTYRFVTPTYVKDLVKAMIELSRKDAWGVFHVSGHSLMSRYAWLKETGRYLGWDVKKLLAKNKPMANELKFPTKIQLDTAKFRSSFKTPLHSLKDSLSLLKQDMRKKG